ncbi:TM0106 family RecB-like putative nuclease [Roseibium aestuarii]|uniref:TM0106 family RecB-like putative nuclease n=1 Tax=Roseibium aestuarii TaxID=2600299 RepID=A0ABW4JT26_9HYPH|nr:TM0106 family RecB-like putative nuclease [Roseibium aestuarii]
MSGEEILLSATDLMRFMGCRHATALDLAYGGGADLVPCADSEDAELLQRHGDAHEAAHLAKLKTRHVDVIEIERGNLADKAEETKAALRTGASVIFQGAFFGAADLPGISWGGWSDFLERVETPSNLGAFSYEVSDTKLKRRAHPKHVLQLVLYSDLLTDLQGRAPDFAHVELGDASRATLRLADYRYYARRARKRLEAFVREPSATRPIPCSDCGLCRWRDHCAATWKAEDSLFQVANIMKTQVKKLERADIRTLEQLSEVTGRVRGIGEGTLDRLKGQARLQQARKTGEPAFELRPRQLGKGFALLPHPQPGDLFYDIEGDPHYEGGLEYLHGLWFDGTFKPFWAHDHKAEAEALRDLLEFFRKRLEQYPQARIYHYAPYEVTALRRLTTKYGIGEAFLDRLQRESRFVDLYAVVRGGIQISEPNYSIKSLEVFYGIERSGEVKTAGGSVVAYEAWRENADQQILDEIEDYNRIDCVSTEALRDWLVGIRPDEDWSVLEANAAPKQAEEDEKVAALRARLEASDLSPERQELLFNLGLFHGREQKPAQWAVFDSTSREEDELIEDLNTLGGLRAWGEAIPVKRSFARTYQYPEQDTKLRKGDQATVPVIDGAPARVTIEDMDPERRLVTVKGGPKLAHLLEDTLSLHPDWPLETDVIASALRNVIADQCDDKAYRAVEDLLSRSNPRLKGWTGDIFKGEDTVAGTIAAVTRMDETVLPIQGPPGTGKTHVSARAILSLVQAGYRVGVASNSHEAIRNVLLGCETAMGEFSFPRKPKILHKVGRGSQGYPDESVIWAVTDNEEAEENGAIVGGTAFFFARPNNIQAFDWLFVDEAGQVSLANMLAMGRAARNIVLVGDPCQLPQVIQGSHPEPANLSCLEYMLGDHQTVPPEQGIFLPISRRMHPDVCSFISEQVYEDRLTSHHDTALQDVVADGLPEAGAWWVPVEHEGNAQVAREEVAEIRQIISTLVDGIWTGKDGRTRPLTHEDIIIVAPFSAQVNALREALPEGIRVGTVDKFQGQEAPVCIVSMTASSAEDAPRGMDFLYSLNRINVAVSRAKGLALVVGSDRLCEAKCETIAQMKQVNTLCALKEWGGE